MKKYLKTFFVYLPIMVIIQVVLVYADSQFTSEEQMFAMFPIALGSIAVYVVSNIIISIWSYKRIRSIVGVNGFMFFINCIYEGINSYVGYINGYLNKPKSFGFLLYSSVVTSAVMAIITIITTLVYKYYLFKKSRETI